MGDTDRTLAGARRRLVTRIGCEPRRWFLVDVDRQELTLIRDGRRDACWTISTAAAGIDAREDSGGTPPGVHRIAARIGKGAALGTVFANREPTGESWRPEDEDDAALERRDLILARILALEGLEEGVNRGPGVDSLARYIYLHGTNQEGRLGRPVSHGCVRLSRRDVVEVFDAAREGDLVVIV